ncbi:phage portal protein [Periweissella cryptocerci]|uniref:Phage portal protein n=1 Tax=Periweissella cryptocerci TaxID=2506420 RepID=A0A4P6YRU6_9LACO|nr:phage portal protein [Periweissella cryptocerci]QBO35389.1 phage portal protein [Periweissella cryptocerci]
MTDEVLIPVANEFENDINVNRFNQTQRYDAQSNIRYTYNGEAADLLSNLSELMKFIQHHKEHQAPRLKYLKSYADGNNVGILTGDRRIGKEKADNRATHSFGEYIANFFTAYDTGVPLKIAIPNDDKGTAQINEINDYNKIDALNTEVYLDAAVFGRGYELWYRSEDDKDVVVRLDPLNTFVIYNFDIKPKPIMAVSYRPVALDENKYLITVYTNNKAVVFNETAIESGQLVLNSEEAHAFERVPIVEWQLDRERKSTFEKVIPLINLYDGSESDTANYMQDLVDAMLVITGDIDGAGLSADDMIGMARANILALQSGVDSSGKQTQMGANYIYKQYDVAGIEAYKKRLTNDIHKFSYTIDLTDSEFMGNISGEAMKYKLLGMQNKASTHQNWFIKGLIERYHLVANIESSVNEWEGEEYSSVAVDFTPNLPKNVKEAVETFSGLGLQVSQKTMLSQQPYIDNPDDEIKQIQEEADEREAMMPTEPALPIDDAGNLQGGDVNAKLA